MTADDLKDRMRSIRLSGQDLAMLMDVTPNHVSVNWRGGRQEIPAAVDETLHLLESMTPEDRATYIATRRAMTAAAPTYRSLTDAMEQVSSLWLSDDDDEDATLTTAVGLILLAAQMPSDQVIPHALVALDLDPTDYGLPAPAGAAPFDTGRDWRHEAEALRRQRLLTEINRGPDLRQQDRRNRAAALRADATRLRHRAAQMEAQARDIMSAPEWPDEDAEIAAMLTTMTAAIPTGLTARSIRGRRPRFATAMEVDPHGDPQLCVHNIHIARQQMAARGLRY